MSMSSFGSLQQQAPGAGVPPRDVNRASDKEELVQLIKARSSSPQPNETSGLHPLEQLRLDEATSRETVTETNLIKGAKAATAGETLAPEPAAVFEDRDPGDNQVHGNR